MGYAYLLTHPGMPCVFWSHFFDWGTPTRRRIDRLIRVRKLAGLHADSRVEIRAAKQGLYAAVIDGRVAMKLGSHGLVAAGGGWRLAADGDRFAVWMRNPTTTNGQSSGAATWRRGDHGERPTRSWADEGPFHSNRVRLRRADSEEGGGEQDAARAGRGICSAKGAVCCVRCGSEPMPNLTASVPHQLSRARGRATATQEGS